MLKISHATRAFVGSVATIILLLAMMFTFAPAPVPVQAQNTACFRAQGGALWACADGGTMEFRSGATLDVQDGATALFDSLAITKALNFTPSTTQTVTMNDAVTADAAVVLLSSAGTVNTDNVSCGNHGDRVTYINVGAQSIVFTDTGTLKLSGTITLGAADNIVLQNVYNDCIEISRANN